MKEKEKKEEKKNGRMKDIKERQGDTLVTYLMMDLTEITLLWKEILTRSTQRSLTKRGLQGEEDQFTPLFFRKKRSIIMTDRYNIERK